MEKIYKGEIQRLMPIFQAIAEGKTIQYKNGDWQDIDGDEDGLNLDTLIKYQDYYRIKPEQKYRPFKNAEECWQEMLKHQPFGWLKDSEGYYFQIVSMGKTFIGGTVNSSGRIVSNSYRCLYNGYTFTDGLPFGVKLEE